MSQRLGGPAFDAFGAFWVLSLPGVDTPAALSPPCARRVSTWTLCGGRLVPRRANERYTAEPTGYARLGCQAYHRHPGRTRLSPPAASTRSLQMPAGQRRSTPWPLQRKSRAVPPFLPRLLADPLADLTPNKESLRGCFMHWGCLFKNTRTDRLSRRMQADWVIEAL